MLRPGVSSLTCEGSGWHCLATGKHNLKPAGKEVKVMKPTHKEYEQRRQELLNLLYTMVDELEHNPSLRRRGPRFPESRRGSPRS